MTLAIVLEVCNMVPGRFHDTDPFLFVVAALVVFASGGAALFVTLAVLRERLGRRTSRRKRF
jgi:hypothetical protein